MSRGNPLLSAAIRSTYFKDGTVFKKLLVRKESFTHFYRVQSLPRLGCG